MGSAEPTAALVAALDSRCVVSAGAEVGQTLNKDDARANAATVSWVAAYRNAAAAAADATGPACRKVRAGTWAGHIADPKAGAADLDGWAKGLVVLDEVHVAHAAAEVDADADVGRSASRGR